MLSIILYALALLIPFAILWSAAPALAIGWALFILCAAFWPAIRAAGRT